MKRGYRFVNSCDLTPPPFLGKLTDAVGESWNSMGSVGCKISQCGPNLYEVLFFPALREVFGGKSDGEVVFPGFSFNVGKFVRVFDTEPAPKVAFDNLRKQLIPHLSFKGQIDGVQLQVNILECPPSGQEAIERVYTSGPKKGTVEAIE